MTIYNRNHDKDQHQLAIIGNPNLSNQNASNTYYGNQQNKETKQRNFADELKKQIEERDFLRKKEEWRKTKASNFVNPSQQAQLNFDNKPNEI